jgi:lipoate-protein ligase B
VESNGSQPGVVSAAWFGRVDYAAAWSWQRELFLARLDDLRNDTLMLLVQRHSRGIDLYQVDRGGRATYHGPGQLVGYPILALGERYDVLAYLRKLEEVLIRTAADLGVEARRDPEHTGVWVGSNKIGAIGVKITRGISMHGFAFNVSTDLSMFEGIVPCGIQDRWVTSVLSETGQSYGVKEVGAIAANHLAEIFERRLTWIEPKSLMATGIFESGALSIN